jgi:hypothetical protein
MLFLANPFSLGVSTLFTSKFMKRLFLPTITLMCLTPLLLGQPAPAANTSSQLQEFATTIQTELENHGERILGRETYRWSTRLQKVEDCRAELSVRVTSNYGDATVRTELVRFSLGALEPYGIELKKSWLVLPCAGKESCISSNSTCSTKTKEGIVSDCSTASQKRVETLDLQLDGDPAAAARLEQAFRDAVKLCRAPAPVAF